MPSWYRNAIPIDGGAASITARGSVQERAIVPDPDAPAGYAELLSDLKQRIRAAQVRTAVAVNQALVLLYWQIGREILTRQSREGWGTRVIDRLAADL